jgi:hypothetical protein
MESVLNSQKEKHSRIYIFVVLAMIAILVVGYLFDNSRKQRSEFYGISGQIVEILDGVFVVETPTLAYGDFTPSIDGTWLWHVTLSPNAEVVEFKDGESESGEEFVRVVSSQEALSVGDDVIIQSTEDLKIHFANPEKKILVNYIGIYK